MTADPDPGPIVIDLRETYTVGPVITVLDRLAASESSARVGSAVARVGERLAGAPARALGLVLCRGFAAGLLGTSVGGTLTWPVYLFHAFGLLVGVLGFRDHRDAESPVWGTIIAVFVLPSDAPDEP